MLIKNLLQGRFYIYTLSHSNEASGADDNRENSEETQCVLSSLSRTYNVNFAAVCAARMALIYLCVYPLHARFARGMLPFVNNCRHRTLTAGRLQAPRHAEKKSTASQRTPTFPGIL